jgi:hypothetical protein
MSIHIPALQTVLNLGTYVENNGRAERQQL